MSQVLVDVVLFRIRETIQEGNFSLAAFWVLENALTDTPGNQEVIREALSIRNQYPKLMYAIEDILSGKSRHDELPEITPEVHDQVIRSLATAGWYGRRIPRLLFSFPQPPFKLQQGSEQIISEPTLGEIPYR